MDDFMPATVVGYSEWPKNTPNYWALPAMGDAVGWTYRKDWFSRPEIQAEFKKKYGRDLAPPKTYDELKQIAEFFQGREIDGKKVYGAYIFTERGSEGITMGVTNVLYDYGFEYENPKKPYHMEGFVNSPGGGQGARVLQGALQVLHAARHDQRLHVGRPRRLQVRPGGDADELVRLLPRPLQGPECRRRQDRLLRQSGRSEGHFTQLGGQGISVVSYSDHKDDALNYIKWFAQPDVQKKWWALGGYSCAKAVVNDPGFPKSAPFAPDFLKSMEIVKDFWAEPAYAELLLDMQKRVHDYVVADKGTAKEALDLAGQGLDEGLQGRRQDLSSEASRGLRAEGSLGPSVRRAERAKPRPDPDPRTDA